MSLRAGLMVLIAAGFGGACRSGPQPFRVGNPELRAPLSGDAPAEILHRKYHYLLQPRSRSTVLRAYLAFFVRTPAGLDIGNVAIPRSGRSRIHHFEAQVHAPDGSVYSVGKNELEQVEVLRPLKRGRPESLHLIALPNLRPGSMVEVSFMLTLDRLTTDLQIVLGGRYPVRRATYTVESPKYIRLDFGHRGGELRFKADSKRNTEIAEFTVQDLPPIWAREPLGALPARARPFVRWRLVATQYPALARSYNQSWKDSTKGVLRQSDRDAFKRPLFKPSSEDKDTRIREIIHWVRDRVRLGPNEVPAAYRSAPASALLKLGVASEDQLSRVILAVLRSNGYRLPLVLVPGANQPDAESSFPTPAVAGYDHVILLDEVTRQYFDPYCYGCRIGELAQNHQDRGAIKVNEIGAELHRTPDIQYLRGTIERRLKLRLSADEMRVEKVSVRLRGGAAAWLRGRIEARAGLGSEFEDFVRRSYFSNVRGGRVEFDSGQENSLSASVRGGELLSPQVARVGALTIVAFRDAFPIRWLSTFSADRTEAVVFRENRGFTHHLEVEWKRGQELVQGLTDAEVKSPFGRYRRVVAISEPGRISCVETLTLMVGDIVEADYPKWRAFIAEIREKRGLPLVLEASEDLSGADL